MATTTVKLDEVIRDKLQAYKNDHGMTYNGAIMRLLEIAASQEDEDDNESGTEQTKSSITTAETGVPVELPRPQKMYREGASGASEFVTNITGALMAGAGEYGTMVNNAVWSLYGQMDIEPRIRNRTNNTTIPNLDDLIEHLENMTENPADYTLRETAGEIEHVTEQAKRIQRALLMYRKMMNDDEISLESKSPPSLNVPRERTYRGKVEDHVDIVTADDEELTPRPDLTSGVTDYSWGYRGTGPHTLATALLADAYTDRYARARAQELTDNFTTQLEMGEPWEITAGELKQHMTD